MTIEHETTRDINDPTAVPWHGTAGHREIAFSTMLVSQIDGNLWMGGCINDLKLGDDFKYVISLYPWEQYKLGESTTRVEVKMYDGEHVPDAAVIWGLAELLNHFVANGKTLVHCQAGLNRSGLIAASALILQGFKPWEAVNFLRSQRADAVLCNPYFEKWLLQVGIE